MMKLSSFCIFFLLALLPQGAVDTLVRENQRLAKSNSVLLQTLKRLTVEERVGEELVGQDVKSTCQTMTEYRACTGPKHKLVDTWSRRGGPQIHLGYGKDYMGGEEYCRVKCENMGIAGCCEWQVDNNLCLFTPFTSSTIADSGSRTVWGDNWESWEVPMRYGSVCSVSNCVYQMESMPERWGDCDWGKQDKAWQKSKGGSGHSVEDCMDFCLNDPGCVFAARSSTGYCHIYKTCNANPGGAGWISKQKVCKGTLEYNNHASCPQKYNPEICIPPGKNA